MAEKKKKYSELTEEEKAALSEEELAALKAEEEAEKKAKEDGGEPAKTDETPEEKEAKEGEQEPAKTKEPEIETITLPKTEYEELLKNKYAEGARKAEKSLQDQIAALQVENQALKAREVAATLVNPLYVDDLIALTKGKGLEVNEANLKEVAAHQPAWQKSTEEILQGQARMGASGDNTPPALDERAAFKKLFNEA
ncbi:MAG TPA: hypothetical protein PKH00_01985 [Bacilli bacterium]|nr:hypothetical protein [Bacilli bacterium]